MRLLHSFLFLLAVVFAIQPVPTRTIIDVLNSSPQFSDLIELLQQHELIPLINESFNCTLLAPVNSAFTGIDKSSITRDQLLYHFINATAYSSEFEAHTQVYQTFLDGGAAPISLSMSSGVNDDATFDDLDLLASPQRGLVHSLSKLVRVPQTLSQKLYLDRSLSSFAQLLDDQDSLHGCTVFAPTNHAVDAWLAHGLGDRNLAQPILDFLRTPFGKRERNGLLNRHIHHGILKANGEPQEISLADGSGVTVHPNHTIVGAGFEVNAASYLRVARDGLYYEIGGVLDENSENFLEVTPEKIILGLGGYSLVRGLSLYGYRNLIDGSEPAEHPRSIVVPLTSNDQPHAALASKRAALVTQEGFNPEFIANPSSMFLYQFLKGELPENGESYLLNSEMPLRSGKSLQRVHFERRRTGSMTLNWEVLAPEVYHWKNNTFYISEELLAAPPSLTMALGPLLISSFSMSFLDKLNRLRLPTRNSWTVLVPTRDAWEKNILLKEYLDENDEALACVFNNLILDAPFYSDSEDTEVTQFSGLATNISWNADLPGFYLQNSEVANHIEIESTDALFDNGVAHIVNTIPLPRDLEISTSDLITAGGRTYFLDLLRAAGMDDVLEPAANFTVLVPPTKELEKNNFTTHTDREKLQNMLKLHLIPNNQIEELLDGQIAETLAGEKLEVQSIGPFSKLWGLRPVSATEGQRVLIYETGGTNGRVNDGSSVMFIDRHISPQWIAPIHFGLRKGTYAILGLLFGLVLASSLVFGLVWLVSKQTRQIELEDGEQVYRDEEQGGAGIDDDNSSTEEAE